MLILIDNIYLYSMIYQINTDDNKWLSLRGNKINRNNIIDFNIKNINDMVNQIIDTEFTLKFKQQQQSNNIHKTTDTLHKYHVRWFIV